MAKNKAQRYGLFYLSNGRYTTSPYAGATFTKYALSRQPLKGDIKELQNNVLKAKVKILPVNA